MNHQFDLTNQIPPRAFFVPYRTGPAATCRAVPSMTAAQRKVGICSKSPWGKPENPMESMAKLAKSKKTHGKLPC